MIRSRKNLSDLTKLYSEEEKKGRENLATDLGITPELMKAILGKKEAITPELAEKIEELYGQKINNTDEVPTTGDEIKIIDNYEKLEFFEKTLAPRDFNDRIYGLQDIPNIPWPGEQVVVIDCSDGKEYPIHIQTSQHIIIKPVWDKFNRRKKLKPGDVIGIALDPEDNHIIYVDFEYKERDKSDGKNQNQIENQNIKNQDTIKQQSDNGELKMEKEKEPIDLTTDELLLIEKNIVVRGPPGTGKTFEAIQVAERTAKNGENKLKLDKLKDEGYADIVTFHDAYGYEAFIEGITFYTEEEGVPTDSLKPMCKPGVFKEMCKRALVSAIKFEKISDFIRLNKKDRKRADEVLEDLSNGMEFTWNDSYEEYRKAKSEGRVNFESAPKFVLVIDEINRGDVQKIFGDAITIIEKNKRLGAEEELTVELPNSRDIFGIPSNVYIIGTMNMVDRSVNQLDAALQRRFGLVYKRPDLNLIDDYITKHTKEIDIHKFLSDSKTALEKINERLCEEHSIGRDRQFGHSYLLGIRTGKELAVVWRYKIIPQIEDYCAGNTDKVNKILFGREEDSDWIKKKEGILGFKNFVDFLIFIEKIKGNI